MDVELVDPALRGRLRRVGTPMVPASALRRHVTQLALRVMPVFPVATGVRVERPLAGRVRGRMYLPPVPRTDAALLWIHGGGLVIGDARQDAYLCSTTASELGMPVLAVNYRLAPGQPFPAAHDDVLVAWQWLQTHAAAYGVDPARIVVGGESAGAGIAAALVQRLHDDGGTQPLGQWLFAPMLDDRTAADQNLDAVQHWVWDNRANRFGWESYLGGPPGGIEPPRYAVPARREDLSCLPPAFIAWGDIELFAAEDAEYARRLAAAGVAVATEVVPGAPHGFESWAPQSPPAVALLARARRWLADLVRS